MNEHSTKTAPRVAPPLGDLSTRHLARWLSAFLFTGQCSVGLRDLIDQRGATLADVRTELRRRETVGVGVR